jgi:hypothetical protein
MPSIVGTWKLVGATARDAAGAARPSPYGGNALGRVTFGLDPNKLCALAARFEEWEEANLHGVVVVRHGKLGFEHYCFSCVAPGPQ